MSLINEALKRARQAPAPPARELQLRPVEPPPSGTRRTVGLALPAGLVGVALLALLLVWKFSHAGVAGKPDPQTALSEPPAAVETAPGPAAAEVATTPVSSSPGQPGKPVASAATAAPQLASANTPHDAGTSPGPKDSGSATASTNAPAVVAPPPPPPLKLQAVVYNPKRPSAMINGKTLFLGDRIREFRLVAIRQDSATLVAAGLTNVLTLSE